MYKRQDYIRADTRLPAYLPYPRFLLKMEISQTAKLLYSLLLDRSTLSQKNKWQDDEGIVVAGGEFKRKFLVLEVVLADINVKALGRAVVERMGGDFLLFPCRPLAADAAVLDQLFF